MALRPAYGFQPYGFRLGGLPAGATGFGGLGHAQSRYVVIIDKFGETHAAELGERESVRRAAQLLAEDLGLDAHEAKRFRVVRARDAGEARLIPLRGVGAAGVSDASQLDLGFDDTANDVAPTRRRRVGVSRKPGRIARCKVVKIKQKSGKTVRRRLCWDKHGVLAANTKAGARGGKGSKSNRKVVCKRKCKNGGRAVCTGGYRKVKGKRVCKKFICRKGGA